MSDPNADASAASVADKLDGTENGAPEFWRVVHLLREAEIGDLQSVLDGTAEGPNTSTSMMDQVATLAKILTRRYKGKDIWDMVAAIHDKVVG